MNAFRPIVGPAISSVEGVQVLNVTVQSLLRELPAVFLEAEIREDPEP